MNRMALLQSDCSDDKARALLARTQATLGKTPNLYRAMANAPAALDGYLSFRDSLGKGLLDLAMRERIALLVAEDNHCEYCVSAHIFRGAKLGLSEEDLSSTRKSRSADPRVAAALAFVRNTVSARGFVTDDQLQAVRQAGWSDQEIGEMVAHVALNTFSNYFNHLAQPALDFPRIAFAPTPEGD